MPLYLLSCHDVPDSAQLRAANRPVHLEYLWSRSADIMLAGALMDPSGQTPVGSHFVLDLPDEAAVSAFADADPFHAAGLFAERTITRFRLAPEQPTG